MAREKKESRNFACKLDKDIFERLEEFCELTGQNKTLVVERAVNRYLTDNIEKARRFNEELQ